VRSPWAAAATCMLKCAICASKLFNMLWKKGSMPEAHMARTNASTWRGGAYAAGVA
jgi:hypothetical protein